MSLLVVSPDLPEHHRAAVASLPAHYRFAAPGEPADCTVVDDAIHTPAGVVVPTVEHDPGWRQFLDLIAGLDLVLVRVAGPERIPELGAPTTRMPFLRQHTEVEAVAVDALVRLLLPPPSLFGRSGAVTRLDAAGLHSPAPVYENRYRVAWRAAAARADSAG